MERSPADRGAREQEARLRRRAVWLLAGLLAPVVAAVIVGAVILWPHGSTGAVTVQGVVGDAPGPRYVTARTETVRSFVCQGVGSGPGVTVRCAHLTVALTSGPDRGKQVKLDVDPTLRSGIRRGDGPSLARFRSVAGQPVNDVFVDFTRTPHRCGSR